jgi:hypothetical protein
MLHDRSFYDAFIDWRGGRLMTRHVVNTAASVGTGPYEWQHNPKYRVRKLAKNSPPPEEIGTESPPSRTSVGTESATQSRNAVSTRVAGRARQRADIHPAATQQWHVSLGLRPDRAATYAIILPPESIKPFAANARTHPRSQRRRC